MEKLNGTSMDIVQDNVEKLKQIFPEIISEGKIDFGEFSLNVSMIDTALKQSKGYYEKRCKGN